MRDSGSAGCDFWRARRNTRRSSRNPASNQHRFSVIFILAFVKLSLSFFFFFFIWKLSLLIWKPRIKSTQVPIPWKLRLPHSVDREKSSPPSKTAKLQKTFYDPLWGLNDHILLIMYTSIDKEKGMTLHL